jgi:hypothetical protein
MDRTCAMFSKNWIVCIGVKPASTLARACCGVAMTQRAAQAAEPGEAARRSSFGASETA